jgi:6,7-dimethyl-8-ribityllumazine synthase
MLKPAAQKKIKAIGGRFAIVASEYNAPYVDAMLEAAETELKRAGAQAIDVIRVPGAYEIPLITAKLARQHKVSAIICLGVILRGQTVHAEHIGRAVSHALMEIQLRYELPVIHEVLLLENEEQARVRCLAQKFNRGAEAANTALDMARVMQALEKQLKK